MSFCIWILEKKTKKKQVTALISTTVCLPVRALHLQMKHDNDRIFSVPIVDLLCSKCSAVLQLICIAIIMEWRRVETSKTLFYWSTVTCRDAPIQIKYHYWTKFPSAGLLSYMACGKSDRHTEELQIPGTNMSYTSITLSSDNRSFKLFSHSNGWNQYSVLGKSLVSRIFITSEKLASVHP